MNVLIIEDGTDAADRGRYKNTAEQTAAELADYFGAAITFFIRQSDVASAQCNSRAPPQSASTIRIELILPVLLWI